MKKYKIIASDYVLGKDDNICVHNESTGKMVSTNIECDNFEEVIKPLLEKGIIKVIEEDDMSKYDRLFGEAMNYMANKSHLSYMELINWFKVSCKVSKAAALQSLLMCVAKFMDKKYSDDILSKQGLYTITYYGGRITQVSRDKLKNYPLFRSKKEAEAALKAVHGMYEEVFKSE